jgi:hypothetical protein
MCDDCGACVVPLHDYYRPSHLAHVIEHMMTLGPPTLRAHLQDGRWYLHEGTHRLRAAIALGLTPVLVSDPSRRMGQKAIERARHRRCGICGHTARSFLLRDTSG